MSLLSAAALILPVIIGGVGLLCFFGRRNYFDLFLAGASLGLETTVKLLPTLVALLVALRMLSASGLLADLAELLSHGAAAIGIPPEMLPLLLSRPFSGSASTAAYSALLAEEGTESFPALCASVIMGSSDTVVYICSVYFSSIRVRHTRHALPCAIAVMLFSVFFASAVCRFFFA